MAPHADRQAPLPAPRTTAPAAGTAPGAVLVADGHRDRPVVALVDDDEHVLALAGLALSKHGIGVVSTTTAAGAVDLVVGQDPDVLVLDIVMPDMSGWEVLRRVRDASDVPVLLLSGRDSDVDKARGLDLGADDYLTKPFSFLEFEARVRALLRRRRHDGPVRDA